MCFNYCGRIVEQIPLDRISRHNRCFFGRKRFHSRKGAVVVVEVTKAVVVVESDEKYGDE